MDVFLKGASHLKNLAAHKTFIDVLVLPIFAKTKKAEQPVLTMNPRFGV